ncbi:MAG TPA: hypothetical protein VFY29_05040 [Terriglobia bacterium]|nr:hypothetical protein [Terriglobia bacterium]
MDHYVQALHEWLLSTPLSNAMKTHFWAWPMAECIHFIGLCLLIGTVGLFDLRLMGFVRRVPVSSLHRLVPFGVLGYCMNALTGMVFLTGFPGQYIYNPAFQSKMLFMAGAGINVIVFYLTLYRRIVVIGPNDEVPVPARIVGAVSFICWMGVIFCGRFLTFYRPPYHWCPWC